MIINCRLVVSTSPSKCSHMRADSAFHSGGNTMIQLTVLYGQPQDPAAFDRYYREVHAPLAKKLSGLKGYTSNKPTSLNQQEPSPYYLIDTLYFENREALQAIFQSRAAPARSRTWCPTASASTPRPSPAPTSTRP